MCVVSMVHDHYWDKFKPYDGVRPGEWQWPTTPPSIDLNELARLIADFKAAMAAAKKVDDLTGQPDCVDPEKAKLQERVAELEAKLASIRELTT